METYEHKEAGDQIRIALNDNIYLRGGTDLSADSEDPLYVTMMHKVNGVPVPLDLELSAGDVICLAGDYYTKAGWGLQLQVYRENEQILRSPVSSREKQAFRQAYDDLASPRVTQKAINRIYKIDKSRYIPGLLKELLFSFSVKGYGKKLLKNEAHFAPWSLRAYIVGHHSSLHMAELAYYCYQKAEAGVKIADIINESDVSQQLRKALEAIQENQVQYGFKRGGDSKTILIELGHRYHAMAVACDLFTMHFYSDHFAAGHLSRIGQMRRSLPEEFGVWGSILVNNMHNEDNEDSVTVTNPFQPRQDAPFSREDRPFRMIREDNQAYGDGTYSERQNDENSNMLINGMDNSLGDIARLIATGEKRAPDAYGGLTFLPEIDYGKRQTQPLLILGMDNKVYFRSNVRYIKMLSPFEYQDTLHNPTEHGYEKLTYWKAIWLVLLLRLSWSSPQVDLLSKGERLKIERDEERYASRFSKRPSITSEFSPNQDGEEDISYHENRTPKVGAWRRSKGFSDIPMALQVPLSIFAAQKDVINVSDEEISRLGFIKR